MKRQEVYEVCRKANDLRGIVDIKDYLYNDGPNRGMRAFDLKNGKGIEATILADRCLDVSSLWFKGYNISLNNRVAVRSPYLYTEEHLRGFMRQYYGGLFTTCGTQNVGGPVEDDGEMLGCHGNASNIPAENVGACMEYEGDELVLRIRGHIRESRVFKENIHIDREITVYTEKNLITVHDVVENRCYFECPLMLIYHVNFGYPILDEGAKIYCNGRNIEPRSPFAAENFAHYGEFGAPVPGIDEQNYYHSDFQDKNGFAMLHNENLGIAAVVHFNTEQLPVLCQWKSMKAGDYALGLEPTIAGVNNRVETRESGKLYTMAPGEVREFNVAFEMLDDAAAIGEYIKKAYRA